MFVSICWNGRRLDDGVLGEVALDQVLLDVDVAVWGGGCNTQEERLLSCHSIVEEVVCFLCKHVRGILAFIAYWLVMVALKGGVEIAVSVGVEEEVGASPAGGVRGVVVGDGLCIEKLADIVGAVAS